MRSALPTDDTSSSVGRTSQEPLAAAISSRLKVELFLDHADISTSSRYLKPSKLALHTTIQRIHAQRRASGEAAKWEEELAELQKNLPRGAQKGPHADKIDEQREVKKAVTPPTINRLGA